jgi:hypothetical protein
MKFQDTHPEGFAPNQTVALPKENPLKDPDCDNFNQWKNMLPFSQKEGVLLSNGHMDIHIQFQEMKYLVRCLLTFKSKNPLAQISDIDVRILNSMDLVKDMLIEYSPVRYVDGKPP